MPSATLSNPSDLTLDHLAPLRADIEAHVSATFPQECCGLVIRLGGALVYQPCRNLLAGTPSGDDRFAIDPEDWAAAEDAGDLIAVVHSHPNASAHPTDADRVMCETTRLPWLIMGWPHGVWTLTHPTGSRLPLLARTFHHGVVDCYTLVRDFYWLELGIDLPDFPREDDWWTECAATGRTPQNLYRDQFEQAGFVEMPVGTLPQAYDVLLMMIGARVENHAAVMTPRGTIVHHLHGRLSCEDVWGGDWQRRTTAVLRHQRLLVQDAETGEMA